MTLKSSDTVNIMTIKKKKRESEPDASTTVRMEQKD